MKTRIAEAAREGVILAVKWGIAALVVGAVVAFALTDYFTIKRQAGNGERAYQYLVQVQQQQQQAKPRPAPQKETPTP